MPKRYEEALKLLTDQLDSNEWPVGSKIPREIDLCEQYGFSRTTLRHALSALVQSGRLHRIKGFGTYVTQQMVIESTNIFVDSFAGELAQRGQAVVTEVLEFRTLPADADVAAHMGIEEGANVVKLCRLRYARGRFDVGPVMLTTSYFREDVGRLFLKENLENHSVRELYQKNGLVRIRNDKKITAVNLPPKECRLLGAAPNQIFIAISSVITDSSARCVEYVVTYYPVDRNEFTISIGIPQTC